MELVIFVGLQASGKSTFSCSKLSATISGDLVSMSSAVSFFIFVIPLQCLLCCGQFGFQSLDLNVQLYTAIELLFFIGFCA